MRERVFTVLSTREVVPSALQGKNAEAVGEDCLMHGIYSLVPILQCIMHNKFVFLIYVPACVSH